MTKWISNQWEWFKGFFSEESGPSTIRVLNWIWIFFLCFNLTFIILYNAIKTGKAELPPISATAGYVGITGLLLGAKVGQRIFGEKAPVTSVTILPPVPPVSTTVKLAEIKEPTPVVIIKEEEVHPTLPKKA